MLDFSSPVVKFLGFLVVCLLGYAVWSYISGDSDAKPIPDTGVKGTEANIEGQRVITLRSKGDAKWDPGNDDGKMTMAKGLKENELRITAFSPTSETAKADFKGAKEMTLTKGDDGTWSGGKVGDKDLTLFFTKGGEAMGGQLTIGGTVYDFAPELPKK